MMQCPSIDSSYGNVHIKTKKPLEVYDFSVGNEINDSLSVIITL